MRFYGLTDGHVLGLPIGRFWMLNANIDRLSAQEEYRFARAFMVSQSSEQGVKSYFEGLSNEIGQITVKNENAPDYEGIQRLKLLAKRL